MSAIINEFDGNKSEFEEFKTKVEALLHHLIKANRLRVHQISSRLKTTESLSDKIARKQTYSSIKQVTDIIGCRIITFFEDEVDKIASIIEKEFDIDPENSIDKRKIEFDRFGYLSLHFVVQLNKTRIRLTEYKKFKGVKFEIQIRSILQHSWAEIEHDLGYKGKHSIPDRFKRRFSRIAALLETADLEFVQLKKELHLYERSITNEIKDNPENVTLDKASLLSFIKNNIYLIDVDKAIAEHLKIELRSGDSFRDEQIYLLEFAGIKSIADLNNLYQTKSSCIVEFSKKWRTIHFSDERRGSGIAGISIYDAAYYLISQKKQKKEIVDFLENKLIRTLGSSEKTADECLSAIKQISKSCR